MTSADRAPAFAEVDVGRPLFMQIADQLIAAIEAGTLAVGAALPSEAALTEQFRVSRATVRQALAVLQFNGWVESRRGSGTVVCAAIAGGMSQLMYEDPTHPTHPADLIDLLEARLTVEVEAIREAAGDPVPEALAQLEVLVEGMHLAVDADGHGHTDLAIHLALVHSCPNPFLAAGAQALLERSDGVLWRQIRDRTWDDGQLPREWVDHHRAIVAAVTDRDPELAVTATRVHLLSVLDNIAASAPLTTADHGRVRRIHARWAADSP